MFADGYQSKGVADGAFCIVVSRLGLRKAIGGEFEFVRERGKGRCRKVARNDEYGSWYKVAQLNYHVNRYLHSTICSYKRVVLSNEICVCRSKDRALSDGGGGRRPCPLRSLASRRYAVRQQSPKKNQAPGSKNRNQGHPPLIIIGCRIWKECCRGILGHPPSGVSPAWSQKCSQPALGLCMSFHLSMSFSSIKRRGHDFAL